MTKFVFANPGMTPAFLAEKVRVLTMWRPALMSEIVCSKVTQPFVTCSGSSLIKSVNILEFLYYLAMPPPPKEDFDDCTLISQG